MRVHGSYVATHLLCVWDPYQYTPGISETGGDAGEHTSWNPRALRNWVICFGILVASYIITVFLSDWIIPLAKKHATVSPNSEKVLPWPHITPVYAGFLWFHSQKNSRVDCTHCLYFLSSPFHSKSGFYFHNVPWKTFLTILSNPVFSWFAVPVLPERECRGWSWPPSAKPSPLLSWFPLFWLTFDLPGPSFLVLADWSSPSWSLTGECFRARLGHLLQPCPHPRGFHPALWL